eukprot:scaffold323_cov232-Pinguiococcus_pyrenoidosus.AAC.6
MSVGVGVGLGVFGGGTVPWLLGAATQLIRAIAADPHGVRDVNAAAVAMNYARVEHGCRRVGILSLGTKMGSQESPLWFALACGHGRGIDSLLKGDESTMYCSLFSEEEATKNDCVKVEGTMSYRQPVTFPRTPEDEGSALAAVSAPLHSALNRLLQFDPDLLIVAVSLDLMAVGTQEVRPLGREPREPSDVALV